MLLACAILLPLGTLVTSCSKKSNAPQPGVAGPPQITSFTPSSGTVGATVTIEGSGFSNPASQNQVTFNGKPATIVSGSSTSIIVTVPAGAGSGKIAVTVAGKAGTSTDDFNYTYTVSTLAGDGAFGLKDGTGTDAQFKSPYGLATDAAGNIYVADSDNNSIRKITPAGAVTTITGNGSIGKTNGALKDALFNYPHGLVLDAAGNIYVADAGNNLIRKISVDGVVSTLAGSGNPGKANGAGAAAEFNFPAGITIDGAGNLYVTDGTNGCIRKITPTGVVSNFTGAVFNFPEGIAIDAAGNLYVADTGAGIIRKATATGTVTDFAGSGIFGLVDGLSDLAQFFNPEGLAIDKAGNLYVGDLANSAVRKITPAGIVSTIAGNGTPGYANGVGPDARFHEPSGITVDAAGTIYVSDIDNSRIRKLQ